MRCCLKTYTGANNQKWKFIQPNDTLQKNPDPDCQNKSNWCWAASAKMVANHNGGGLNPEIDTNPQMVTNTDGLRKTYCGYGTISGTERYFVDGAQYAIVKQLHGNDKNTAGSVEDSVNALQYASANNMDVGYKGKHKVELSSDLINEINNDLMNGKYIIGSMADTDGNNGHSVVIKSYSSSADEYVVFNPWDGSEQRVKTYDLFHSPGYNYAGELYGRVEWFKFCR